MITIIAGSRDYADEAELAAGIEASGIHITEVVCGGAPGADELGRQWAIARGIPVEMFPADWDRYGKRAGPIRNGEMASYAEALVAFPLAKSKGTLDMIAQAEDAQLLVHVHRTPGHRCHANGCQADDCHPEVPFCQKHFKMLHPAHQKRLWGDRPKTGRCGACSIGGAQEAPWRELVNLGIAILLVKQYGDCGAPPELHDETGFCWGCGVADAGPTYERAKKAVAAG
jgi:hypothetical protein